MAEKPRGMRLKFVLSQLRTCTHESKNMFVFLKNLRFYGEQESVKSNTVKLGGVSFNLVPEEILIRFIFSFLENMFIKIQYLMSFLCVIRITGCKELITFSSECISLRFRLCRHLSHSESQISIRCFQCPQRLLIG